MRAVLAYAVAGMVTLLAGVFLFVLGGPPCTMDCKLSAVLRRWWGSPWWRGR